MKKYFTKRRKVFAFAVVVMAITLLPYLVGYAQQGDEWRYTGFVIGVEDGNSYLAKMLSGASGSWLFRSPHSAVDQKGVLAYLPYILLGKLAAGPALHDQLVVLYHLARFIFGSFAILATYDFIAVFIKKENLRLWALALVTLGGGLGWVLVAISQKDFFGSIPLEFISPESFGFLGIFGFPHLAAARALFLWGLTLFLSMEKGYLSGFLWLVMGFFQPMVGVIAWAVIFTFIVIIFMVKKFSSGKHFAMDAGFLKSISIKALQAFLVSAPIVVYTAIIFIVDPYFKAWTAQNRFPSPHIIHYLFAYGVVLPFAITGIRKMVQDKSLESLLLAGWLAISPVLIYAPVITQRRLAEGIWAVLIIGMIGNFNSSEEIPFSVKLLSLVLLPSTLFIFLGSVLRTSSPSEPLFRPIGEVNAYKFIATSAEKNEVLLSSFHVGNNLPAWAPIRVVMGHGPETIGLRDIIDSANSYFNTKSDNWKCTDIYTVLNAEYLFWGPLEKEEWNSDPEKLECLTRIYNDGDYSIFKVNIHQ